jgi:hypothetical protein
MMEEHVNWRMQILILQQVELSFQTIDLYLGSKIWYMFKDISLKMISKGILPL